MKKENLNKTSNDRLLFASSSEIEQVYDYLSASEFGLSKDKVAAAKEEYGINVVTYGKKDSLAGRIFQAFVNPFSIILFALAGVSAFTDVIMAEPGEQEPLTVIIITTMIMISGILRFVQETRSGNAAARLVSLIRTTTCVERKDKGKKEIPLFEVVVGDIVHLSAGDMIPADLRMIFTKDLFITQSALTGESEPVEKFAEVCSSLDSITDAVNLAFMGSSVINGSAKGVVVATGNDTLLGKMAKELTVKPPMTTFEKGVNSVSWVLIRFMLVMVPIVLFINGFTKGDWMQASLFAVSVAVGLTPEMLPMLVTTCLAKGAVTMSHKKVIIKNLNAIQNLGSMDILCTDKTGTLTQDKVALVYHLDIHGDEDMRVLRYAFLNSYYQTGLKNLMDIAVIDYTQRAAEEDASLAKIWDDYAKVDEVPFDFNRRRMSVVVADKDGGTQMITKGAVEEMIQVSSHVEYGGAVRPITDDLKDFIISKASELNEKGMRVIAVARKVDHSPVGTFSVEDEKDMVLIGYLAFFDPPKESAARAITALTKHGVTVKVLTGDNEKVSRCICRQVGLSVDGLMLGSDVDKLTDRELTDKVRTTTIFSKLSPTQKARVVRVLREDGHSVGYMGDGINDAAAMKASDVGISVDTAVDIAKESADVILLEKNLMVLEDGIIEGRRTYANMIKYIKITASSNFGNVFSVLAAGAFLPFLPMQSIHLILLNLIYDISCIAIPWDNVDMEFIEKPRQWDASSVGRFMVIIGPTSSIFDIATYVLMYFVLCPAVCGGLLYHQITDPAVQALYVSLFQTGWFIESMWSQTLVIHMIRTPKIPFIQSRASLFVFFLTGSGIAVLTAIPFTRVGKALELTPMPSVYFAWLACIILCYMITATVVKKLYVRKYGELL